MQSQCRMKAVLAVGLAVALAATGCSASWVGVALADLPVLTQMALNIATVAATLQSGKQLSAAEAAAIANISAEASSDLNLLEVLYNEYKGNPNAGTLQKIEDAIGAINQNLPVVLRTAHIADATLSARVTAAVNLILTTVTSFAQLIPQTGRPTAQKAGPEVASRKVTLPRANDLKKQWNLQVCGPTGKAAWNEAMAACVVK